MEITLHRLLTKDPRWESESVTAVDIDDLKNKMLEQPFQGEEEDRKFGFAHCGREADVLYGLFVQKFPKTVTDYNDETKEEINQETRDSGEYLFVFYPKKYEIYIQARRSGDLPGTPEIINRFTGLMKLAVGTSGKFAFSSLERASEQVDRERIVELFYNEADTVTELELEDFDRNLILEQKNARGGYQTYFNPVDEYQPAMEAAALRFGSNTEKASIKAKPNENFKKDPIARAMLEGSKKPVKIVYKKDSEVYTEYGVTKTKEVISLESENFDLDNQIEQILARLDGLRPQRNIPSADDSQVGLFGTENEDNN